MLSYANPRTIVLGEGEARLDDDARGAACAGALLDAARAPTAAAHSTRNVFKGKNPGTGGRGRYCIHNFLAARKISRSLRL
jgi:hypothetical protein